VYTTAHNNRGFYCIDWKTGETKYKEGHSQGSMIYADGMLYCYDDKGGMSLIKPNPDKFELVSKFEITLGTHQHWAHPVIHNGVMYIRHGDSLMAYKIK
jgi:outer membrane protein assembly factor BamB